MRPSDGDAVSISIGHPIPDAHSLWMSHEALLLAILFKSGPGFHGAQINNPLCTLNKGNSACGGCARLSKILSLEDRVQVRFLPIFLYPWLEICNPGMNSGMNQTDRGPYPA